VYEKQPFPIPVHVMYEPEQKLAGKFRTPKIKPLGYMLRSANGIPQQLVGETNATKN
jgi:hypothetical protein